MTDFVCLCMLDLIHASQSAMKLIFLNKYTNQEGIDMEYVQRMKCVMICVVYSVFATCQKFRLAPIQLDIKLVIELGLDNEMKLNNFTICGTQLCLQLR